MANDNIIDYGEVKVPTSWEELTLKQFSDIQRYYASKDKKFDAREVLHILTNLTLEQVNDLPMDFTEKILDKLGWLTEAPTYKESTNRIVIDGEEYIVNVQNKLKTGEFIATQTILKEDKYNYAAILAVLARKRGEEYDLKYENEVMAERIGLWEAQPMMEVMPLFNFFMLCFLRSSILTRLYSKVEEALNLVASNISTLRKSGAISVFSSLKLKAQLRRLRKSMPRI